MAGESSALTSGQKYERKHLVHLINTATTGSANWLRLGKDLESYAIDMNPDVEQKKNIIGESTVNIKGYEPNSSVDTYYARKDDALWERLYAAVNNRATGDSLKTQIVDVIMVGTTVESAYKEDVVIVPQSIGGEDGIQIPFQIYYDGNRASATVTYSDGSWTVS